MRKLLLALAAVAVAVVAMPAQAAQKVLLVVSANGRDGGETRPGFEFDEYAQAWDVLRKNGIEVEVASPTGGKVEPDTFEKEKPYNATVAADGKAMAWLTATKRTDSVDPKAYAAVYVLGGGGAMFDILADRALQSLLGRAYEAGAVVGGVCHGPAVLARVILAKGRPLVKDRRVTGYTNAEEAAFGERWSSKYPVLLEDVMKASGARFEQGRVMLPHVVADARVVTGQNPSSTAQTVEAMLRAMGKTPVERAFTRTSAACSRSLSSSRAIVKRLSQT